MIPNVLTFPGPELKALTTAAWIFLDFMGLPVRTGLTCCYCCGWVFLSPSFRLITVNSERLILTPIRPQNSAPTPSFLDL